jgi:hypothetical protein
VRHSLKTAAPERQRNAGPEHHCTILSASWFCRGEVLNHHGPAKLSPTNEAIELGCSPGQGAGSEVERDSCGDAAAPQWLLLRSHDATQRTFEARRIAGGEENAVGRPHMAFPAAMGSGFRGIAAYDVTQLGDLAAGSTLNRIHMPDNACPGTPQAIRKLPLGGAVKRMTSFPPWGCP